MTASATNGGTAEGTALVTGGAGFIGSHLVDLLVARGIPVRVVDNLSNGRWENIAGHGGRPGFEFRKGTVLDRAFMAEAMEGVDRVFHLACLGVRHSIREPLENHRVNAEGALVVLEAARQAGVDRFLYCSSSEVYGTAQRVPMTEDHPTRPSTVYGASKLAGEAYARAYHRTYGLPTVIVRPFNTFGPRSHHEGDAGELIPKSIVRAMNDAPLLVFGDGRQTRDFTFVEDTARGLLAASECDGAVGATLNMGSRFEVSVLDVAKRIIALSTSRSTVEFLDARPGDVGRLCADASLFGKLVAWSPTVPFEEGLVRTIDWFRSLRCGAKALLDAERPKNWL